MSSPTDPSTVTCRYWATSGTCFFGDQCNFSHSLEERGNVAKSGAVPKKEKACRNLLLTGYCKDENGGCEYNHDIVGITRMDPPNSAQLNSSKPLSTSSAPTPPGTAPAAAPMLASPKKPGTPGAASLVQTLQARSILPVSAPAFVPAAVAAAQRAALNAWGGITPGKGGGGDGTSPGGGANGTATGEGGNGTEARAAEGFKVDGVEQAKVSANGESSGVNVGLPLSSSVGFGSQGLQSVSTGGVNTSCSSAPGTPTGGNTPSGTPQPSPVKPRTAESGVSLAISAAPSMKSLPANINAAPFIPKSASLNPSSSSTGASTSVATSRVANVNAAPFVPNNLAGAPKFYQRSNSTPGGGYGPVPGQGPFNPGVNPARGDGTMSPRMGGGGPVHGQGGSMGAMNSPRGVGGPAGMGPFDVQRRQMSQFHQQALHQQQHAAAAVRGRGVSLPQYPQQGLDSSHRPYSGPASFGLPEGDDPALGMSSMSPPHPRGGPRFGNNQFLEGGQPNHRLQDAMSALKMGDGGGRFGGNPSLNRSLSAMGMSPRDEYRSRTPPMPGMMQSAPVSPMKQQMGRATPPLTSQGLGRPRPGGDWGPKQAFGQRSNSPNLGGPVPTAATQVGGATYFFGPGQGAGPSQMGHGGHVSMGLAGGFGLGPGRPDHNRNRTVIRAGTVQMASRFLPESLREEIQQRAALVQAQIDPEQDISDLPEFVGRFHTLYPLESSESDGVSSLGVRTTVFKGISSTDGLAYAIRRIDHRQVIPTAELATAANETIERWSHLAGHPHVGVMREAFVSKEIEDSPALYFAYDYYPGAVSLEAAHLQREQTGGVVHLTVTEDELWSYTIQLATALRAIHGAGLIARGGALDASKVLITSRGRIRLCSVGFLDVLHGDPAEDKQFLQRIDLAEMGRVLLSLACGSAMNASLDFMAAHYSPELVRITQALIASSPDNHEVGGLASIKQLTNVLGDRMFSSLEHCHVYADHLMDELEKESENGRLLRIIIKSSMINERPDDDVAESNWSETGDRYLLKLFRDFVFHQTTEEGKPAMDWGHIIEALNKLDAGVSEKVTLLSRDEQSLLVASYKDLKRCLEGTYSELQAKASNVKRRPSYQTNPLLLGSQPIGATQAMGLR